MTKLTDLQSGGGIKGDIRTIDNKQKADTIKTAEAIYDFHILGQLQMNPGHPAEVIIVPRDQWLLKRIKNLLRKFQRQGQYPEYGIIFL
jgi:hypothetical protein